MRRFVLSAVFLLHLALLASFWSSAAAQSASAAIPYGTYHLVTAKSPTGCLDIAGPSKTPGASAQLYTCGDPYWSDNQVWRIVGITTSTGVQAYQLVSEHSGQCLDVAGVSKDNGAHLQQYTCGNGASLNQAWVFQQFAGGYQLVSVNSSACLDLPGGITTPGQPLQQWSCGGGANPNQLWKLLAVGNTPPLSSGVQPVIQPNFFNMTLLQTGTAPLSLLYAGTRSQDALPGVNWRDLEPGRGVYSWANLDRYIASNQARGTDMLYVFGQIPDWASANASARTSNGDRYCNNPGNLADWDDFVRAIATRSAGRIRYWELWNEPQFYYCGNMSSLVTMAQHARDILRSVDPQAVLLSPAGTTENGPYWLDNFLSAGGGAYVDVIACHGYHYNADEDLVANLNNYLRVMSWHSISKPVWDTEANWNGLPSASVADTRAAYVAKFFLLHAAVGMPRNYWYGFDTSVLWGGLTANGTTAPEATAYREVRRWMVGATPVTPCAAGPRNTWSCTYTRGSSYAAQVLWNPTQPVTVVVPAGYVQYRRLDGTLVNVAPGTNITVSNAPILLETYTAF